MSDSNSPFNKLLDHVMKKEIALVFFSILILFVLFNTANRDSGWERIIVLTTGCLLVSVIALYGIKYFMSDLTSSPKYTITPEDRELLEPLIKEANEKAIDQYVRLSSLSGATGTATRLGLTGLPLATIGLTVFFSLGAMINYGFLDLAKLTLGAFIGSFVQKAVVDAGARSTAPTTQTPTTPKVVA